jgi:choline dehydrogenase-like flavoprotein
VSNDPDWDVVIAGSGAGGSAAAWGLCRRGLRVLLLEAGPRFDPASDHPLDRSDWEARGFPAKPGSQGRYAYALTQPLIGDESTLRSRNRVAGNINRQQTRQVIGYEHVRAVGGSTLHFTGESHRLHPASFRMRSRFGVAADWPLSYADLEPYYCEAEELVGVAGPPAQGARWRSRPFPLPPHPLSWAARTLGRGAAARGLTWQANSRAALSRPYHGRVSCNYCGGCQRGCPRGDKGSADVTFLAAALASGRCTLRPDSPVIRVEAGSNDRIAAVLVGRSDGKIERIAAPRLVLAAGAVETPRLLLASDNLGNESGEVGRNFMETLIAFVGALHPEPQHGRRGLPDDAIAWDYNAPDSIPGVIGGCRFYNATGENSPAGLQSYALRAVPGWGRAHGRAMRDLFGHALMVGAIGESLPHAGNRVSLDPDQRDAAGVPLARISAGLQDLDIARLRFMAKTASEILAASGAEDIFETYTSWDRFVASHVFGTCRMGDNPGSSVVDPWCRSHRWHNLFVADGSVFPSSGGGEAPSLTIQALALRMADRLA